MPIRLARAVVPSALVLGGLVALVAPGGAAGADGYVFSRTSSAQAGKVTTVRASVNYDRADPRRVCRLTARTPAGRSLKPIAKPARASTSRVGWKIKIPRIGPAGTWSYRIACPGSTTDSGTFEVAPARIKVGVSDAQFVGLPLTYQDDETYGWAARIANPSAGFEIREIDVRAVFRDSAGRIVTTVSLEDFATLTARETGLVSGRVTIEGEVPATVSVSAVGDVAKRQMVPVQIRDLRLVTSSDTPVSLSVRGEAFNVGRRAVRGAYALAVYDAQGRLLNATSVNYRPPVPAGQSRGIDEELGQGGAGTAARVEAFWPASPDT